jgi:hypothetical protein
MPASKRKATRILTSTISKLSGTAITAILPLLFLSSTWSSLLHAPVDTLTFPLLPALFMLQTGYIILLLPLHNTTSKPKKRTTVVKVDSLGDAIKTKVIVCCSLTKESDLILAAFTIDFLDPSCNSCVLYHNHSVRSACDDTSSSNSPHRSAHCPPQLIPAVLLNPCDP